MKIRFVTNRYEEFCHIFVEVNIWSSVEESAQENNQICQLFFFQSLKILYVVIKGVSIEKIF